MPPSLKNSLMTASKPHIFLSFCGFGHLSCPASIDSPSCASRRSCANLGTQPVSRNSDWFDGLCLTRPARRFRQSWTTMLPCDKEPSSFIRLNTRSNAFSNATSFCNSVDDCVRSPSSNNPAFRITSRLSSNVATSLEVPNAAPKTHSCVRSGREVYMHVISFSE